MRMRALLLLPSLVLGCATASGESRAKVDEGPIVIELFTSQGCSSCPAADAILNKLAKAGSLNGRTLAPLAFHVDYWDDLGWPDPYASAGWTERQREYAESLGDKRVYTPELVVGGRTGMVGSYYFAVAEAIGSAPKPTKLTATATWSQSELTVEATAPSGAPVYVAIWQDGTKTKVPRGENAGETLAGDRVVRSLVLVANAGKTAKKTIKLDSSWQAAGAVAFAQQPDRKIVASVLLPKQR